MRRCLARLALPVATLVSGLLCHPAARAGDATAAPPAAMRLHYVAYVASLPLIDLQVAYDLGGDGYDVRSVLRLRGVIGLFATGEAASETRGIWQALRPLPSHYDSHGVWRGEARRTVIDYDGADDHPLVRALLPDPDPEAHEPVPVAAQAGSIDTLSGLAALLRQVRQTGRCEASAKLFDGRRLSAIAVHTGGTEVLAPTRRSVFAGPALRCDVEGRLLAGFRRDDDRERAARPQHGSVWFAPAGPGQTIVPVRITFETRLFGAATMYLAP